MIKRLTSDHERGAVAISVALAATLLFGIAALAVDLGNSWARGRNVQKQADVSALGAGYLLPMIAGDATHGKAAIATQVRKLINAPYNEIEGQGPVSAANDLIDGSKANGEITFQNDDGSACTDNCTQMTVLAPEARVGFGFASAIGFTSNEVQRTAVVRVFSQLPPKTKTLPFWLPSGCGYGPTEADTTQNGNGNQPTATATATATGTATATPTPTPIALTPVGTHTIGGAANTNVGYGGTTQMTGFTVNGLQPPLQKATLRAVNPTGTAYVDLIGADVPTGNGNVPQFQLGTEVSNTPGVWTLYAIGKKNNNTSQTYSSNHLTITVGAAPTPTATTSAPTATASPTSIDGGCVGQDRGNFGQLSSPHTGYNLQQSLGPNIAFGLDHQLVPYVFPPNVAESKDCGKNTVTIPGGKHDDTAGSGGDGANCIQGNTGNDGPKIFDGLISGMDGKPGRLDTANGSTTCAGRNDLTVSGKTINNDTLACYLRNGATLSDISQTSGVTESMLNPEIVKSPRFVYLPVVYATDRAQKDFQPIKMFVAGFITQETQSTGPVDGSGLVNGLEIQGNSVSVLHVYVFNRDALPEDEQAPDGTYNSAVGGSIVRLVG